MDYKREVAAIAVIETKAFELEKLAEDVGENIASAFIQLVKWIVYGDMGNIKNTMGTEKAKTWLDWSIRHGEDLQYMIHAMENEMGAERFNSICEVDQIQDEDGLMAIGFRFDVTIH